MTSRTFRLRSVSAVWAVILALLALGLSGMSAALSVAASDCGAAASNADLSDRDLSGCNLSGKDLSGAVFWSANLTNANLTNANLTNVNLQAANLSGATLTGVKSAKITGTGFTLPSGWFLRAGYLVGPGANLAGANLTSQNLATLGVSLANAKLDSATLTGVTFGNTDLSNATLTGAKLTGATFDGANLTDVSFAAADLTSVEFKNASNLTRTTFTNSTMIGTVVSSTSTMTGNSLAGANVASSKLNAALVNVSSGAVVGTPAALNSDTRLIKGFFIGAGANLRSADLSGANLNAPNLSNADLTGANLLGTNIDGANLDGAKFTSARLASMRANRISGTPSGLPSGWAVYQAPTALGGRRFLLGPSVDASGEVLDGLNLSTASLSAAKLSSSSFNFTDLTGADLRGVDLRNATAADDQVSYRVAQLLTDGYSGCIYSTGNYNYDPRYGNVYETDTYSPSNNNSCPRLAKLVYAPLGIVATTSQISYGCCSRWGSSYYQKVAFFQPKAGSGLAWVNDGTAFLGSVTDPGLSPPQASRTTLSGADLSGANLEGATLLSIAAANANLSGADLDGVTLTKATLDGAKLSSASARRINLSGATLSSSNLNSADLSGSTLSSADLSSAVATGVKLASSDLSNAKLGAADLSGSDLTSATMNNANVEGTKLAGSTLASVTARSVAGKVESLPEAWRSVGGYLLGPSATPGSINVSGLDLTGLDLSGASLAGSDFSNAKLTNVVLRGADVRNSNFTRATLTGVDSTNAQMSGEAAKLDYVTSGGMIGTPASLPPGYGVIKGYLIGQNARLQNASLAGADLSGLTLIGANFASADLQGANLSNSNLSGTVLLSTKLSGATLVGVKSSGIAGQPTSLPVGWCVCGGILIGPGANLTGVSIDGLDLSAASLVGVKSGSVSGSGYTLPADWGVFGGYLVGPGADLGGANLTGVNLSAAKLYRVKSGSVTGSPTLPADWTIVNGYLIGPGVDLSGVNLSGMALSSKKMSGALLDGATVGATDFTGTDFGGGATGRTPATAKNLGGTPRALPVGWRITGGTLTEIGTTPPPQPALSATPGTSTKVLAYRFEFFSEPGASYSCSLDGVGFAPCTSPYTGSFASAAVTSHTFRVQAKDSNQNVSAVTTHSWSIDQVAPGAPSYSSGPPEGAFSQQTSVSIGWAGAESGGTFECSLDGDSFAACTSPRDIAGLTNGQRSFKVRQVDAAGNIGPIATRSWTVDTAAPVAPAFDAVASPVRPSAVSVAFTGEPFATFECSVDAGGYSTCTSPRAIPGLADGSHSLKVRQTDRAGNTSDVATASWVVDGTAPAAPTLRSLPATLGNSSSASATFTGEDGASFACSIDGGSFDACSSPRNLTGLTDGAHTFAVKQTDRAGNTGPAASQTWTVDTTPPSAPTLSGVPASITNATSASISFTGEAGSTFTCAVDSGAASSCTSPKALTGLADGLHSLTVAQTDRAGNSGPASTGSWTIDTVAPAAAPSVRQRISGYAVGAGHTCAVAPGGGVLCWGVNASGQLGDGTTTDRSNPTKVRNVSGATALAAGNSHTCALLRDGTVKCWGSNSAGQLGDGSTTNRPRATEVKGLAGVAQLAAGNAFTCARLNTGSVKCWGSNANGRLGNGASSNSAAPVTVYGLTAATALSVGAGHACVVDGGAVKCWGSNAKGQLGDGSTTDRLTRVSVSGLTGSMQRVAAGGSHSCAANSDAQVWCWGDGSSGQLGTGSTSFYLRTDTKTRTAYRTAYRTLYRNESYTSSWTYRSGDCCPPCSYMDTRTQSYSYDRGYSFSGSCGNGYSSTWTLISTGTSTRTVPYQEAYQEAYQESYTEDVYDSYSVKPVLVASLSATSLSGLAAGSRNSCALATGNQLKCWGAHDAGQLLRGDVASSQTPQSSPVASRSDVTSVGLGGDRACVTTDANGFACSSTGGAAAVTGLTVAPNAWSGDSMPLLITGDAGNSFSCAFDSGAFNSCTDSVTFGALGDGSHKLVVTQTDPAGNRSPSGEGSFALDRTPPVAPVLTGAPSGTTKSMTASVAFTGEPSADFECSVDSGPFTGCDSPFASTGLADGAHTVSVRQIDAAGNTGPVADASWTVDTTAPVAPILSSEPASFTNGRTASIIATGEAGAALTCSVDGAAYVPCVSPLTLGPLGEGSHSVSVKQTDAAGNVSAAATAGWVVDVTQPTPPVLAGAPGSRTNLKTASVAFSGEANATFTCSVDGGAFAPCASPKSVGNLSDGPHSLAVKQADRAGNVSSAASAAWTVDSVAPAAPTLGGVPVSPSNAKSLSITISGEANATFTCSVDGGAESNCVSPKVLASIGEGSHTLRVIQTDDAGNASPASERSWTTDLTAPSTPILTASPSSLTTARTATFVISGDADAALRCSLDSGAFTACTSPRNFTDIGDGDHTFAVKSVDTAGNESAPKSYMWKVDATVPSAPEITSGPADYSGSKAATFAFVGEQGAVFACSLDGAPFGTCSSPAAFAQMAEGQHTFKVMQTDTAGNASGEVQRTWRVDVTPPAAPAIVSSPKALDASDSAAFKLAGEAGASFLCSLDGATLAVCDVEPTYQGLDDGKHTFSAAQVDQAGNRSPTKSFSWTVDTTPPATPTVSGAPKALTSTPTLTLSFGAVKGATFQCSLDSKPFVACTSPFKISNILDGDHRFVIRYADAAGNFATFNMAWTLDTKAPAAPTIDSAPDRFTRSRSVAVGLSTDGDGVAQCSLDTKPWVACGRQFEAANLADGLHSLAVRQVDGAGNASTVRTASWRVDNVAPARPTLVGGPGRLTNARAARIGMTGESGIGFQCSVDGSNWDECTAPLQLSGLADGEHAVGVRQVDQAGNEGAAATVSWKVDTVAPTLSGLVKAARAGRNVLVDTGVDDGEEKPARFEWSNSRTKPSGTGAPIPANTVPWSSRVTVANVVSVGWVRVSDAANNWGEWQSPAVGPAPPGLVGAPAPVTNKRGARIGLTGSAGMSYECSIDDADWVRCASPTVLADLSDGEHSLAVRQVDSRGVTGLESSAVWTVDTTPPALTGVIKATRSGRNLLVDSTFDTEFGKPEQLEYSTSRTAPATAALPNVRQVVAWMPRVVLPNLGAITWVRVRDAVANWSSWVKVG